MNDGKEKLGPTINALHAAIRSLSPQSRLISETILANIIKLRESGTPGDTKVWMTLDELDALTSQHIVTGANQRSKRIFGGAGQQS